MYIYSLLDFFGRISYDIGLYINIIIIIGLTKVLLHWNLSNCDVCN